MDTKKGQLGQEHTPHTTAFHYTDIRRLVEAAKRETRSRQAKRLVDYLLENPGAYTGQICQATAIGNISAAANYMRPALQKRGLTIIAEMPSQKIPNRFGEPSMSHQWRLQKLGGAV